MFFFFFSSRRRHTRWTGDWSSDVCSSDLADRGATDLRGSARASTLQGLAYSLLKTGEIERAAEIARKALQEAGSDDPALLARILNTLSIVQYRQNRHQEALAGWKEALARARQAADDHLILMIAHNLGLP